MAVIEFVPPVRLPSPCVGICRLDAAGRCEGCHRTRDEIMRWTRMAPGERDAVMARLAGVPRRGKG